VIVKTDYVCLKGSGNFGIITKRSGHNEPK